MPLRLSETPSVIVAKASRPTRLFDAVLPLLSAAAVLAAFLVGCANPQVQGGNIHLEQGRVDEAEAQYRRAVAEDPDNPEAHFNLARVLAMKNEIHEANVHFTRAEELNRGYRGKVSAERERFARQYQENALSLVREMRPLEAMRALDSAETMNPGQARTAYLRGRIEVTQGRLEEALGHYRAARERDPRNSEYAGSLTETLIELGRRSKDRRDYASAVAHLEEAIAIEDRAEIHYLLGSVSYAWAQSSGGDDQIRHLDRAAAAFGRVLDRDPSDQDASYNLAAVLLAGRRFTEAADLYRRLIAANPHDGELYMALALAHGHLGESGLAMAEEAIGRALRADQPVSEPASWAKRSAERFPRSDLASVYRDLAAPDAIMTYQRVGGGLMEVWFYWNRGVAVAFREGGRHGDRVPLPRS